jgi:hypothetical protein
VADCFEPRHRIRITAERKTTDFVICFQCNQVKILNENRHEIGQFLIASSPQAVFDQALHNVGVQLPRGREFSGKARPVFHHFEAKRSVIETSIH